MLLGEVDVVLVGVVVDAGAEVHSVEVPVVPPIPGNLSRPDPAPVGLRVGRFGKVPDDVSSCKVLRLRDDTDDSPRELLAAGSLGDVVVTAPDNALKHVVSSHDCLCRAGCMHSLEGSLSH